MSTIWKTLEMLLAGAVAITFLHIETNPTYLELFFGWAALANAIICFGQLGIVISNKAEVRQ